MSLNVIFSDIFIDIRKEQGWVRKFFRLIRSFRNPAIEHQINKKSK